MNPPLATLPLSSTAVELRHAERDDLAALVRLLAADPLGSSREDAGGEEGLERYRRAFDAIDGDPAHLLVVVAHRDEIVGTLQLSFIAGLARRGALRAQSKRCGSTRTTVARVWVRRCSSGLSPRRVGDGCDMVQLTTDKSRGVAHRFYERLVRRFP